MDRIARRQQEPSPARSRWSCLSWALRLTVLLGALGVLAIALLMVYLKARDIGGGPATYIIAGRETTVVPDSDLSAAEHAFLRGYLTLHAADLERAAGRSDAPAPFTIAPGESAAAVAERLEQGGLIGDATLFRYYLRYYALDAGLEAGEFTLRQTMTIPEIAETLSTARAEEIEIRVTEGWRLEQVADYLAGRSDLEIDPAAFLTLARLDPAAPDVDRLRADFDFLIALPAGATLEGYLFPDTYRLPADATATDLVETMLYTFDRRVTLEMRQAAAANGLSLHGALTLASIVEREAQLPDERPVIASVFLNRLAQGIKLDADPTIQYALGFQPDTGDWWKRPLGYADLEIESPYNTYQVAGLPPGPIANPGLAAIEAVVYPAATDYLYFVVDCLSGTPGAHAFATTFEEHQANVARCQ
jgi:UPF0755 protein